jgi:hypothetical protein
MFFFSFVVVVGGAPTKPHVTESVDRRVVVASRHTSGGTKLMRDGNTITNTRDRSV